MASSPMSLETLFLQFVHAGEFEIDSAGRVWRLRSRGKPCRRVRVEQRTPNGYLQVRRMLGGRRLHVGAHRLVWRFFKGEIPAGAQINHRNGIRDDNRPDNLEPSTSSENVAHAHRSGLRDQHGERNPAAKVTDREVAQIRLAYAQGGYTQAELGRRFGISDKTVSKIVRGERRPKQGGPTDDYSHRRQHQPIRDNHSGQYVSPEVLHA